ncbi:MAG: hydrogenase formation protein HypD [Coriobacteriia bacterium]|nr:hydrogenase formation protein HypD [Coriobacteriia bacterium]
MSVPSSHLSAARSTVWRDSELASVLIEGIKQRAQLLAELRRAAVMDSSSSSACAATPAIKIMEVCGTHTMAIAKWGLRAVLPDNITLVSGPGCPVCVTANVDIDAAIALAQMPDVIVATFGDMMKVPGSTESLSQVKSSGADVRIVYSPLDALALAENNPDKQVIFIAVGFETTTPLIAATVKRAAANDVQNFSICPIHKTVPAALRALADDPAVQVEAFILPGHVSTIIGLEPYQFLARDFGVPSVIAGFEPIDILQGILMLLDQMLHRQQDPAAAATIQLAYKRGVRQTGNAAARDIAAEVFAPSDANWRGLGVIGGTGLVLRQAFERFDALKRFNPQLPATVEPAGCQCGDILRGIISPHDCRLFGAPCTPENPIGPCMVSSEGSCAAWYRYYPVTTAAEKFPEN